MNNPLRTFLSVLGVSIGVFCIVSVSTVFDSMEANIKNNMSALGNDVLYVGKFPWIPEEGQSEYPMWSYKARDVLSKKDLETIQNESRLSNYSALSYRYSDRIKFLDNRINNAQVYAATYDFNKMQPIDLKEGRYFSFKEMQSGLSNGIVIGSQLAEELFGSINPIDKVVKLGNRNYTVLGVIKKTGSSSSGFNFDNASIISYNYFSTYNKLKSNTNNGFADPLLMVNVRDSKKFSEMKLEIEGILRKTRGLAVGEKNDFAFNQLDGLQDKVDEVFFMIKLVGWVIGGFSLIVGIFSVANIMFVSVKERTNIIGIKKAIGAKNAAVLIEFLMEAVVLCIIGGILGMLFTFILSKILSSQFEFPIFLDLKNMTYGIILSAVVGIVAGYIPARRAARLNPVEAIRS